MERIKTGASYHACRIQAHHEDSIEQLDELVVVVNVDEEPKTPAVWAAVERVPNEAEPEVVGLSDEAVDGVRVEDRLVQIVHHHVLSELHRLPILHDSHTHEDENEIPDGA
jgi:hypothetical protein